MTIRAIVEIVLRVADIDRALGFYRDTLGLELFSPPGLPGKFLRVGEKDGLPMQIVLVPGGRPAQAGATMRPPACTTSASRSTPPTGSPSVTALRPPATRPATARTPSCPSTPSTSTTPTATKSRSPPAAPDPAPLPPPVPPLHRFRWRGG